MKIAHIADVHWRGLSRHDEYKTVFVEFVEKVSSSDVDHIFIGGDIFHTKTLGISPEYIELVTWWLKTLAAVADVHIILGNHDGNILNKNRQDSITPIIDAISSSKIHLYKMSGVYEFSPGYNWCVFSIFDEESWEKVKPVPNAVNIACYHGPVKDARTESDWVIDKGLNIDFFKDYDYVFLGDIHKHQSLRYKKVERIIDENELHNYVNSVIVGEIDEALQNS